MCVDELGEIRKQPFLACGFALGWVVGEGVSQPLQKRAAHQVEQFATGVQILTEVARLASVTAVAMTVHGGQNGVELTSEVRVRPVSPRDAHRARCWIIHNRSSRDHVVEPDRR